MKTKSVKNWNVINKETQKKISGGDKFAKLLDNIVWQPQTLTEV